MHFSDLSDDAILHVVHLLHQEPLLGLLAVVGLHRSQRRMRTLLSTLVGAQELREEAKTVTYDWKLPRFSLLQQNYPKDAVIRSDTFFTSYGHSFRLMVFPNGNKVSSLSVYVESADDDLHTGWNRYAKFTLKISNHLNMTDIIACDVSAAFGCNTTDWGFRDLFALEDIDNWLVNDVLHISVNIKVSPPPLLFQRMERVMANQRRHLEFLRKVVPLMIADLNRVLKFNGEEQWLRCPKCKGLLEQMRMPKHSASKTRGDRTLGARMACSTVGCECCEVATAHAALRILVDKVSSQAMAWQHWRWPTPNRDIKPEDFSMSCIMQRNQELYYQNRSDWREILRKFSVDLDRFLWNHESQKLLSILKCHNGA